MVKRRAGSTAAGAGLGETFAALADPTRRAMVDRLVRSGSCTVGELAAPFAMSLPAVSKHVSVLERAGLVERRRVGRTSRCRVVAGRLADASAWLDERRRLWEARLDALAAIVEEDE